MLYTAENTIGMGLHATVFLDGAMVTDCIEANPTEGWLVRAKRDNAGDMMVADDCVVTEVMRGLVAVDIVRMK